MALALAGVALVLTFLPRGSSGADPAVPAAPADGTSLTRLHRRLDDLTQRIEEIESDLELRAPVSLTAPEREAEAPGAEVEARMERLEALLQERTSRAERSGADGDASERQQQLEQLMRGDVDAEREERARIVEQMNGIARDPNEPERERLRALRYLRFQRLADGSDARLGVLPDMIALGEASESGEVRADVWRQLSGVTDASLLGPLLDALARDPFPKAREEAAETLAGFLPDPEVEDALRFAADVDEDRGVREQARAALSGGRR